MNAGGRVVDEGGVFDSGVRWTTWYDLAHGGAASLYDVVLTNGTHQQVAWDTVGNQPWSSYTQDVSAAGQTIDQVLTLRAGGTETRVFDMAHGGALQTDTTTRPDGTMTKYVYDTGHANTWSWSKLNQVGTHLTDQLFVMRDGTQELNLFDTAHGDKLLSHAVVQADGSQVQTIYDTAGTASWTSAVNTFDTSGKFLSQTRVQRDGSVMRNIADPTSHASIAVTQADAMQGATIFFIGASDRTTIEFDKNGRVSHAMYYNASGTMKEFTGSLGSGRVGLQPTQISVLATKNSDKLAVQGILGAVCFGITGALMKEPAPPALLAAAVIAGVCLAAGQFATDEIEHQGSGGSNGGPTPREITQHCHDHPDVCTGSPPW